MAVKLSTALRNARIDAIETLLSAGSTTPILKIRDGSVPASAGASEAGTNVLASITLNTNWLNAASGGAATIANGPWTDSSADATGTATFFRIYASDGTTCHIQGTVGTSGTDMIVNTTSFVSGQTFTISTFTVTDGNA